MITEDRIDVATISCRPRTHNERKTDTHLFNKAMLKQGLLYQLSSFNATLVLAMKSKSIVCGVAPFLNVM